MTDYTDTCDWCGQGTNKIQSNSNIGLCPKCCPDLHHAELPSDEKHVPSSWHFMSEEERQDWLDGLSIEEIRENIPNNLIFLRSSINIIKRKRLK